MTFDEWWIDCKWDTFDHAKFASEDSWNAAIAECVHRLRERSVTPSYHQWKIAADWLEQDMKK